MLLVRHGETQANLNRVYHGRLDSPLTDRGVEQARAIGRHIASMAGAREFRIVASPQPRARQTAQIVCECLGKGTSDIALDDRLREVSIGSWEGLNHEEIAKLAPGAFNGDGRYAWCFRAPGGETYDRFSARIAGWLREFAGDPSLVVVTHGIVARVLRGLYAGLPRLEALALPIPQDRIFHLSRGVIEEIVINTGRKSVRLQKVSALPDYRLFVQFDDGVAGTIHVGTKLVDSKAFVDEVEFGRAAIDDFGTICWPAGQAVSAELAYQWLRQRIKEVGS
jgi:broad specificity phosphatase PhoE